MSNEKHIPQGIYTGRWEHFPNQVEGVFTFIIVEADDAKLIGKGVWDKLYV